MIIALSGYGRAGKDTVAKHLADRYGFERHAFADPVREMLYRINPLVGGAGQRVADTVDHHGWDNAKTIYPEIRQLLQRLGTEAGREGPLGQDVWVDAMFGGIYDDDIDICITDARFRNEAQIVKNLGGMVWRVNRPGVGPRNSHKSETELDDWLFDAVIENDGSFTSLFDAVDQTMRAMVWAA